MYIIGPDVLGMRGVVYAQGSGRVVRRGEGVKRRERACEPSVECDA